MREQLSSVWASLAGLRVGGGGGGGAVVAVLLRQVTVRPKVV